MGKKLGQLDEIDNVQDIDEIAILDNSTGKSKRGPWSKIYTYLKGKFDLVYQPIGGGGAGTDTTAIHVDEAGEIAGITSKSTPTGADLIVIEDSADSNNKKKIRVDSIPGGSGGTITYNTVALMISDSPSAGSIVTTLGYTAANDGGGNTYRIVDDASLSEDLGAIINITGNIYAVVTDTSNLTNKHYGVFSDSSTNWPITNFNQFQGMIDASVLYGITIMSEEGTYFNMSLNLDDSQSGGKIHFDNAVFSNLIHVVGTDINNQIDGMMLTGHVTTYDRYGTTWANNILGGLNITCKSDTGIHPSSSVGRGVHIYHTTTNHHYGSIVIEFAGDSGSNVEAAFALDGFKSGSTTSAPTNHYIESVWVQDTDVRGAQITGEGHYIGIIQIDKYGSSTFSNVLPNLGVTSWNSETVANICQGVLLWSTDCRVDEIIVDQKDGFTGRSRAVTDVAIGIYSLENLTTPTIGSIISRRPQRQALSVGEYQNPSGLVLGNIQIPVVDANNLMELNASSERTTFGLVDCYYGSINIGRIYTEDPKNVKMLSQLDVYSTGTQRQNVGVNVGIFHTPEVDAVLPKYDIFQGNINSIIAWADTYNKGAYQTGTYFMGGLELNSDLDVGGAIDFGANNQGFMTDDSNGPWVGNGAIRTNEGIYYQRNAQAMRMYINGVENARLDGTGLGIGKTPADKLDVNGNVRATGYKSSDGSTGATGSFTADGGEVVTVKNGLITSIV